MLGSTPTAHQWLKLLDTWTAQGLLLPFREAPREVSPVASQELLESGFRRPFRSGPSLSRDSSSSALVVRSPESVPRGSSPLASVHSSHLHRRVQFGLGRSDGQLSSSGHVVSRGIQTTHQRIRDEGCQTSPSQLPDSGFGVSPGSHRQPDGGLLYQPSRRHEVSVPMAGSGVTVSGVPVSEPPSPAHPGETERHSRPTVQTGSDPSLGVDSPHGCSQGDLRPLGQPNTRPLCHQGQHQVSDICVTLPGQPSLGSGCPSDFVGRTVGLRVSPSQDPGEGPREVLSHVSVQANSHSSSVASSTVVPTTSQAQCHRTHKASKHGKASGSAKVKQVSLKSCPAGSPRLAASKRRLLKQGFSEASAARIMAPQAISSRRLYDAKWRTFVSWCKSHKVNHQRPSVPQIADFLLFLFEEKKFSIRTIQGYKAAITCTLKFSYRDLSEDPRLRNLLRSFKRERPVIHNPFPAWDLSLVLRALSKDPFEPLHDCDLKLLTLKCVFLTLLASGARRGEIHALDFKSFAHSPNWDKVTMSVLPEFVSKTANRDSGATRFQDITIPALTPFAGSDLPEGKLLCPVRALKYYLAKTQSIRRDQRRLFISYQPNRTTDISIATISIWIKALLKLVYEQADQDATVLTGRSTHAIRSLAASWAFYKNISVEEIMKSCSWKCQSTFASFYLKDMTLVQDQLHVLGPVVVAQRQV